MSKESAKKSGIYLRDVRRAVIRQYDDGFRKEISIFGPPVHFMVKKLRFLFRLSTKKCIADFRSIAMR